MLPYHDGLGGTKISFEAGKISSLRGTVLQSTRMLLHCHEMLTLQLRFLINSGVFRLTATVNCLDKAF